MNGQELVCFLSEDPFARRTFRGVFSRDALNSLRLPPTNGHSTYVINTDTSDGPGSHWVAISIRNGRGLYFDSYGLVPLFPEIHNFLDRACLSWYCNDRSLQPINSWSCGFYCIYFICQISRGIGMKKLLSVFRTCKPYLNDKRVIRLVTGLML